MKDLPSLRADPKRWLATFPIRVGLIAILLVVFPICTVLFGPFVAIPMTKARALPKPEVEK